MLFLRRIKFPEAERIVKLVYFGLLHRLPETTTLKMLATKIVNGMQFSALLESVMRSSEYQQRLSLEDTKNYLNLIPRSPQNLEPETLKFYGTDQNQNINKIIYFCPAISWPVGGIKVLCRHSEIINALAIDNICSEVFFPDAPDFELDWFEHKAKIKRDPDININSHLIVIPEIFALKYGVALKKNKVKYAILVQNGYFIFDEILQGNKSDLTELNEVYQKSAIILSVSNDTTQCIQQAFNILSEKIQIVTPSINQKLFIYNWETKENIITYMPRKLSMHANYVVNHLLLKKHHDWKIIPIEGVNEIEVARLLSLSKIFLSFSDREGLSLPPLEAAFCGNSVIGYTGEGAKEYWKSDLFKEVNSGNLLEFTNLIEMEIKNLEQRSYLEKDLNKKTLLIEDLKKKYSIEKEVESLRKFVTKI